MIKPDNRHAAALILILYGLFICLIAYLLNIYFYQNYGPFYDSLSYLNSLAQVFGEEKRNGIWSAIQFGATQSTVFLPWLIGALLAPFVEPARELAVVIQLPLIFLQLYTGYRFFRIFDRSSRIASVIFSSALISYSAIFYFNGGLMDLRMDLAQALGFGSFVAALAVARQTWSYKDWVIVGVTIMVVCLYRATTPVYISILFTIMLLIDILWLSYRKIWKQYSIALIITIIFAGWYYVLNFDALYTYYFINNKDALADLSIFESFRHFEFVFAHIGSTLFYILLLVFISRVSVITDWREYRFNITALVGGLVPAGYLAFSGAGFNPFVSMASVPGIIIFLLSPGVVVAHQRKPLIHKIWPAVIVAGITTTAINGISTFDENINKSVSLQSGLYDVSWALQEDVKLHANNSPVVAFLYQNSIDGAALYNHLVYEEGFVAQSATRVKKEDFVIEVVIYNFGAIDGWGNQISGNNDQEKTDYIINDASRRADYIVVADEGADLPQHHPVNRYKQYIQQRLSNESDYELIRKKLIVSETDIINMYRVKK